MVTRPRYILAKYVPEVLRNEPRNIGVIIWTPWGVRAQFLGDEKGSLDARKIPSWVQSRESYREWIGSWRSALIQKKARAADGSDVSAKEAGFLDALRLTSKGNYVLGDTGSVLDTITEDDSDALLAYLFSTLVEQETDKMAVKVAFDMERLCNQIIRKTGAFKSHYFKRNLPVICKIAPGVTDFFNFDYALGNGNPEFLYQRVPLGQRTLETSLHAAAWQFEQVVKDNVIAKEKSAALVMPTEEQKSDERYQKAISVLKTQTRVIDLSTDSETFANELNEIAASKE